MKRLRRLLLLFSVFVCCFAVGSASLTASAAGAQIFLNSNNFDMTLCQGSRDDGLSWIDPPSATFSTLSNQWGHLSVYYGGASGYSLLKARFDPLSSAGNLTVSPYMELNCNLQYFHMFGGTQYAQQTLNGAIYLVSPDGVIYEFPITSQDLAADSSYSMVKLGGVAKVTEGFSFQDCYIELRISGVSNAAGLELQFQQLNLTALEDVGEVTAKVVESIDKGFADLSGKIDQSTQDIIDNQDSNTKDIIDNQEQNTQDIIDNENANAGKTHGFLQNIKDGIGNLVNQIVALPGKIWEAIENGLKNLFIPDQEYIAGYKSKWETLLSSRFGAVYQSFEILVDFAESITEADQTNTVSIPRVSIPMPDNNEFVFGPYDVKVVPDATVLNFLVDTCKMITAVVAVFLLVNALRRRWEEIMNAD